MNCARACWKTASIILHGDYYFPDFTDPEDCGSLGRWADLHLAFLKEHQPLAYVEMLFADKLVLYLRDFQAQTEDRYQRLRSLLPP